MTLEPRPPCRRTAGRIGTMTTPSIPGIHHITAIAGDPQRNLDFYATVLGLRLVKLKGRKSSSGAATDVEPQSRRTR